MVVLSRGEPSLADAVRSLLTQDAVSEIVVSHGGDRACLDSLRETHSGLRVEASDLPRTPGAARNEGLAATKAPFVAFLAADCIALPGWVAGRIRRHSEGAAAVASAMAPPDGPPAALASYLLQHSSRMAHLTSAPLLRFGVSYSREALERLGGFDEGLPGEEDVELNARLLALGIEPLLAPDVVTLHAYPLTLGALLRDAWARGRMRGAVRGVHRPRTVLAARALADAPAGIRRASARGSGVGAARLAAALPHLALGASAAAAGILTRRGVASGRGG